MGYVFLMVLNMVGEEMFELIGSEFWIIFDEINYGVMLENVLCNLLMWVFSIDL